MIIRSAQIMKVIRVLFIGRLRERNLLKIEHTLTEVTGPLFKQ